MWGREFRKYAILIGLAMSGKRDLKRLGEGIRSRKWCNQVPQEKEQKEKEKDIYGKAN